MKKIPKRDYTAEFKEQAVKHAQAMGIVVAAKELGLVEQTLRNWVKASAAGCRLSDDARRQAGDTRTDGAV
ncbi:transposase IS3/IS911 family protein (plasmid) [Polaromonas naphthalenivorans CJ2]|uniref:Transposase IS3/IS911 family protein n=1 Tax=Polaromonas naphthalenivorans (strain CJ2) TaxID=365044 RepID=A1VW37_POLNA|nr:transposase IS3/IS911 family protein [Polaromonas naphthalenivorans CJ2]